MYSDCNVAIVEKAQEVDQQSFQVSGKYIEFSLSNNSFCKSMNTPDNSTQKKFDEPDTSSGKVFAMSKLSSMEQLESVSDLSEDQEDPPKEMKNLFKKSDKISANKKLNPSNKQKFNYQQKKNQRKKNKPQNKQKPISNEIKEEYQSLSNDIENLKSSDSSNVQISDIHNIFLELLSCANTNVNSTDEPKVSSITLQELNIFNESNKNRFYNTDEIDKLSSRIKSIKTIYLCRRGQNSILAPILDIEYLFNIAKSQANESIQNDKQYSKLSLVNSSNTEDKNQKFEGLNQIFKQMEVDSEYKNIYLYKEYRKDLYNIIQKININKNIAINRQMIKNNEEKEKVYIEVLEEINALKASDPGELKVTDIHDILLKLLSCADGNINKKDNKKMKNIMVQISKMFIESNKDYSYNDEESRELFRKIKIIEQKYICKPAENGRLSPILDISKLFYNAKIQCEEAPKSSQELIVFLNKSPEIFENIKGFKSLPRYAQETFKGLEKRGWPKNKIQANNNTKASKGFNKSSSNEIFPQSSPDFYWEYDINESLNVNQNNCMVRCDLFKPKKDSKGELCIYKRVDDDDSDNIQAYYIDDNEDDKGNPENKETYGTMIKGSFKLMNEQTIDEISKYYYKMSKNKRTPFMRDACRFIHTDCGVLFFTNDHHKTYKYFVINEPKHSSNTFLQFINKIGAGLAHLYGFSLYQ